MQSDFHPKNTGLFHTISLEKGYEYINIYNVLLVECTPIKH